MTIYKFNTIAHRFSALLLGLFIFAHLINHVFALGGIDMHTSIMTVLRKAYRHPIGEGLLLSSILIQVFSGILKIRKAGWKQANRFDRIQILSGAYLAIFLLAHTSAILSARYLLELETGFYFGALVWITQPYGLFFGLYYFLGIFAFFAHLGTALRWIWMDRFGENRVNTLFWILLGVGLVIWFCIFLAFSGQIFDIQLPEVYNSYLP